jgi:hypothetical protein
MALLKQPYRIRRMAFRSTLTVLALILALLGVASPASSQKAAERDDLKAAFVFQFANYVQWPTSVFKDASSPVVIGIVGNEAMVKTLKASVRGKTVGSRPLEVVAVTKPSAAEACQVLFVDPSDDDRVNEYLSVTKNKPVLTVSDDSDFTEEGGIVRLFEKDNKLRFEINLDEAERAKLTISSKLLGLAQVVHDKT